MSILCVQLRITSIRSRGRFGGVIFSGKVENGDSYVAVCDHKLVPDPSLVDRGQYWKIVGTPTLREMASPNGFKFKETQIEAAEAELLRPSGRNVIAWIAECPDIQGVGQVKATKLYERFGPELIDHIAQKNITALTEVISEEAAELLCHAFTKHHVSETLLWLDKVGISRHIGKKVTDFYKDKAQATIQANPYVLISFEANWAAVDELARKRFNLSEDNPRRLEAAVEECLYRGLKCGHTCLPEKEVKARLAKLLGAPHLVKKALSSSGFSQYRQINGLYQATGPYLIESYLAKRFLQMVSGEDERGQAGLFNQVSANLKSIDQVIAEYELEQQQKLNIPFTLNLGQRQAIHTSVGSQVSLILGGAGTGKTTVLDALYKALHTQCPNVAIYQLALAGLAADRMEKATGLTSMTIASFLLRIDAGEIAFGSVVVVDESSMVDVLLMYRLLRHLPPGVRVILVGDPSQLPPIGPGLVLHALAGHPLIPQTTLTEVKRQSHESGIPKVAEAIRNHKVPKWEDYHGKPVLRKPQPLSQTGLFDRGVSFIPCTTKDLDAVTIRIYEELGGCGRDHSVQVLSVLKNDQGGVHNLNFVMHDKYQKTAQAVMFNDPEFGLVRANTLQRIPLCVGDLVMFTENDYTLELRNGSLGRIAEAFPIGEVDAPCCRVEFDGTDYLFNSNQTQVLTHAYALSVHKGQGSQFSRVVVPIRKSRLLDQAMIYTAVTRGVEQVVLVGDQDAAIAAIKASANAAYRHVTLTKLLEQGIR